MRRALQAKREERLSARDVGFHLLALLIVLVLAAVLVLALDGLLHRIDVVRADWSAAS